MTRLQALREGAVCHSNVGGPPDGFPWSWGSGRAGWIEMNYNCTNLSEKTSQWDKL